MQYSEIVEAEGHLVDSQILANVMGRAALNDAIPPRLSAIMRALSKCQ